MAEGIIRKIQRNLREAVESQRNKAKPYEAGDNPERRPTIDQVRERSLRMQYEHEKAVGGPNTDGSFEEWRNYYRD